MASAKYITCGPCSFDDATKDAGKWCTKCEEGLCEDCEKSHRKSKSSRNHQVISIEDYRKIENVSISQLCEQHGENMEWFCKSHDEVLCVVCVPLKHKACSDVIPISVYSANSKQSSALSDLEDTIEGTLRNVKQCIKNRESATKEIEKQELAIKTMILEIRTKINGKLDILQEKLLNELRSVSATCKSEYMKILQKLESTEEMLTNIREQTKHMKQFSSDIQVFLGTRQVFKRIDSEITSTKREIGDQKTYELNVQLDNLIEKLSDDLEDFGQIKVSECSAKLDFRETKIDQAQIEINVSGSKNVSDIKLKITKTFQIEKSNGIDIYSCVLLPNGHLLVSSKTEENHLIEYSDTGEHIRNIRVSGTPYGIAVIDGDRIVVTYGDAFFIEIMNNNSFNVEKKISLKKSCLGVSHANGRLYVIYGNGIQVLDLSGNQLESFKTQSQDLACIQTTKDQIFYADYNKNEVYCCNLNGGELWRLASNSIKFPKGLTVDNYQNVYVVGYISDNLTIIQHDGTDSKTLLTSSDGLYYPLYVYFDKDTNTLLICNKAGKVALYKVV